MNLNVYEVKDFNLVLHSGHPTADLLLDTQNQMLQINWKGKVNFDDYKAVLLGSLELVKKEGIIHVILNRLDLDELNVECRVWLKNDFLKIHAKPIIPLLKKVATIESKSTLGRIYTNAITKTVALVYPNLSFKSFGSEERAYKWVIQADAVPGKTKLLTEDRPPVPSGKKAETSAQDEVKNDQFLGKFIDFLFGNRK